MNLKVYTIARPKIELEAVAEFLKDHAVEWRRTEGATPSEEISEVAGRICYMSFGEKQSPRTNHQYICNLVEMGHESVLEHVAWTFIITGISRAFSHEFVRHRVGFAFSQLSQQYHDESQAEFVEPIFIKHFPDAKAEWDAAVRQSKDAYKKILALVDEKDSQAPSSQKESKRKIHSMARSVLPNCTETKVAVTANARALRHFLRVRGTIVGDEEMRRVSAELLRILQIDAPSIFADFSIEVLSDGIPIIEHRPK